MCDSSDIERYFWSRQILLDLVSPSARSTQPVRDGGGGILPHKFRAGQSPSHPPAVQPKRLLVCIAVPPARRSLSLVSAGLPPPDVSRNRAHHRSHWVGCLYLLSRSPTTSGLLIHRPDSCSLVSLIVDTHVMSAPLINTAFALRKAGPLNCSAIDAVPHLSVCREDEPGENKVVLSPVSGDVDCVDIIWRCRSDSSSFTPIECFSTWDAYKQLDISSVSTNWVYQPRTSNFRYYCRRYGGCS